MSQSVVVLLGVVGMYFNTRNLGVTGLGSFVFLTSIASFLERFLTFQTWQVVITLGPGREREIFGGALIFDMCALIVAAAIGLAIVSRFHSNADLVLMASLVFRLQDPALGLLRLRNRFASIALVDCAQAIVAAFAAWILWRAKAGLDSYVLVAAGLSVGANLVMITLACRDTRPAMPSAATLKEVARFVVPTGLSSTIGTIRLIGIVPALGFIAGPSAVGLYAVAERISSVLLFVNTAISQATYREIAVRTRQLAAASGVVGLSMAALFGVGAILLGQALIRLIAGRQFDGSYAPLLILIGAHCVSLACVGIRAAIIVRRGPATMLKCDIGAALSFVAAPALMMAYGANGAGLSALLYEVAWLVVVMLWFYADTRRPIASA